MTPKTILGTVLVLGGSILAAFFWNLEFFWFQAGPLGLLLVALGAWDLLDSYRDKRGKPARRESGRPGSGPRT